MTPPRRPRPPLELRPAELDPGRREGLFLGRFDAGALERELDASGLFEALRQRGYPDVVLRTGLEAGEYRLQLYPRRGRTCLVELRLAEGSTLVVEPTLRGAGLDVLSVLGVHWLALQHPKARFTAARPRLPGQRHPGLGLGRHVYARMLEWARSWGKDALLSFPEYFHNAVFYGSPRPGGTGALPVFRFLSAERQGRFEALLRDLAALGVSAAAWALEEGRVVEDASGAPAAWEAAEMVAPLTARLARALESEPHRAAVAAVRERSRYRFSPPQPPHGQRPRSSRKL